MSFSFIILLIWFFFLFSLISLAKGLSILSLTKNQLLVCLIFYIAFLFSISFISALIICYFLSLLTLGSVCSFSNSLKYRVRLFIWEFSCFLM